MQNETEEQIARCQRVEAMETDAGGFTKADLKSIGVAWPPKKGWKTRYIKEGNASD